MTETGHGRGRRNTELVVTKRISAIYEMYVEGKRRPEIIRAVAEQQKKEAAERGAATKGGKKLPPIVWGDDPLPLRTFEFYLKRAKERLLNEGKALMKPGQGDFILAKNFARQDDIYTKALAAGRFEVCRKIVVDQLTMCSLWGVIRVSLSALDDAARADEAAAAGDVGQATRSLPEIAAETVALLNDARKRMGLAPLPGTGLKLVAGGSR